jgi:hypothetical protein
LAATVTSILAFLLAAIRTDQVLTISTRINSHRSAITDQ